MRTYLAITAAVFAGIAAQGAAAQTQVERRVIVVQPGEAAQDADVYVNSEDRDITEADYRGRWNGEWNGEWSADRRRYRGTYQGEYERGGDAEHAGAPRRWRHDGGSHADAGDAAAYESDYDDAEWARRCRREGGAIGAVAGALAGGLLGNRISGRGNRRIGSAVGAVAGAAAGAAIERASSRRRCEDWYGDYMRRHGGGQRAGYGGYDYAYGAQTIIIPGAPVIVEETITEYEDVAVAAPAPAPRVQRARVAPRRPARRHMPARRRSVHGCE